MEKKLRAILALSLIVCAGLCHATEQVEIVLDTSAEMWKPFPSGIPRIVAIRSALNSFIGSPIVRDSELEIGLRTIGGLFDFVEEPGCTDSSVAVDRGPVDAPVWSSVLAKLDARGGRPLVHSIEEAAEDLSVLGGGGRIVVVTSGTDQCLRDIGPVLERLAQVDPEVAVRIIGLDIEHALASSLVHLAPTRNVTDPAVLTDTLRWSMLPAGATSTREEWLELHLTHDDEPLTDATLHLSKPFRDEVFATGIEEGKARIRLAPGRYWATVEGAASGPIEIAEIMHLGRVAPLEVPILDAPEVTLEVVPERPAAGDIAFVQFWGAPTGRNWITIAPGGAPPGEYLGRVPVAGPTGEAALPLPDSPHDLEVVFIHEFDTGILQVLGQIELETARRRIDLETAARAENGTKMSVEWSGDELGGDFITIATKGNDFTDGVFCSPAIGGGPLSVIAPAVAGDYVIRYHSRRGWTLAGVDLEVFEILATLEGPSEVAPGEFFGVEWVGPDAEQDFLSVAAVGEGDEQYLNFSPTSLGSPARLKAPREPGDYELRYVRAEDGQVLARTQFVVNAVGVTLDVPSMVDAGTRFDVTWVGTPGPGDFIAIAKPRWGPKRHLDWSFTDFGSPISLAAPFDTGAYEVRYLSGGTGRIIDRIEIEVR
jgi:Ca-activated chloride channel family protein